MILKPKPFRKLRYGPHWSKTGLAGLWLQNEGEGDITADLSGNGNDGTFSAGAQSPSWAAGRFGPAIDFSDHSILLGLHSEILGTSSTQPFTVVVWAKADAIPAVRDGIVSSMRNNGTDGWDLRLENDGAPSNGAVFSVAGFDDKAAVFATADFVETDWNQYVGRFDGSNVEVFVNAVLGGTADTSTINGTNRNIYIGSNFFPSTPGDPDGSRDFNGLIDSVIIYNRALSATEIQELRINPFIMIDRDPIELWVGAGGAGAPPAGIAILRRRREGC